MCNSFNMLSSIPSNLSLHTDSQITHAGDISVNVAQQTQNFQDAYIMFPKMYLFPVECFKILLPFSMYYYYRYTDFTVKQLVLARTIHKVSTVSWKTALTVLERTLLSLTVFQEHKLV